MAKYWNTRGNNCRWDTRDPWQYRETKSSYGWGKRTLAAGVVFMLIYGVHLNDTMPGRWVTDGVRYMLTVETDMTYFTQKLSEYVPKNIDTTVLKRVQNNILKPADPLMYMTKPVNGKVVSGFGWTTDLVSKRELMHEGIDLEATAGEAVKAAAAGKVKTVADSEKYGKILIIEHSQDIDSVYGFLGEVLVKPEEMVSQGQIVARVGKTGLESPVLYFEVRENGKAVDPLARFKG